MTHRAPANSLLQLSCAGDACEHSSPFPLARQVGDESTEIEENKNLSIGPYIGTSVVFCPHELEEKLFFPG